MRFLRQKVSLAIISIFLFCLPLLLINVPKTAADEAQTFNQNGNAALTPDLSSSFAPAADEQITLQAQRANQINPENSALKKNVYAYIPYWQVDEDADTYLQYKYMTHLIYHGISLRENGILNKKNGPWSVWSGKRMEKIVKNARDSGVKVLPNIVLFNSGGKNGLSNFLNDKSARDKGVKQIVDFLKTSPQPIDGVVIDFEYPSSSQRDELVDFITKLRKEMKAQNPSSELIVNVAGFSYGGGGFDLPALSRQVDGFFIMSYHLKDPRQADKAGSTNPLGSLKSLADKYLEKVPADKIIIGFPLYLAEWKTLDDSQGAKKKPNTGGGISVKSDCGIGGTTCTRLAQRYMKTYGRKYDNKDKAAYYSFYVCSGKKGWRQVYFDDEKAFSDKFAIVNDKNLKGVGFWAQNYDEGYLDTWKAIYNQFADKSKLSVPTKKPGFVVPDPIPNNGCKPPGDGKGTPMPTPTSTPNNTDTGLLLDVKLVGIGPDGNPTPKSTGIEFKIDIYAPDAVKAGSFSKNLSYNQTTNTYKGEVKIDLPKAGFYNVYVTSPSYLTARVDKQLVLNAANEIETITLSPGDVNQDTTRDILDWSLINACSTYDKSRNKKTCPDNSPYMANSDLDKDGAVNSDDLTLWIKEFLGTLNSN